ncbi:lytic murein transglycosylase [Sulfitobacter sp. S190]|uniref:lytic murein transglycosylase n=1 Tax=Sulfitobacter sp. S190 TaxID=2867022 RepID=UPI0021A45005|nr:lytic murein transglycosylase [Sulfitobacter sp. S190]UWR22879.1 lytic murein transglycosylase [Sulfitobacter sp. S190]
MKFFSLTCAAIVSLLPLHAAAQTCGGSFDAFKAGLAQEAVTRGIDAATADAFLRGVRKDDAVLRADRAQGVFQRPFVDFSRRLISNDRINRGKSNGDRYDAIFERIEREYGVPRGVLLAFWAFETDYGAIQGDFNTANALVTLAHDCRRPDLFRPQVFAAMELFAQGAFDPATTTGAWAGEIGMVQMLPRDILENGTDGDGDGAVSLKTSAPDALVSGGKMLQHLGWRAGEPWIDEVTVPEGFDWSQSGLTTTRTGAEWAAFGITARDGALARDLPASLIVPQGRGGPKFLAYPNFRVYFEWNQSFTYVLTAAYFATRLEGAQVYAAGTPDTGLTGDQMEQLQRKLQDKGYDVGDIDGILGAKTRAAVQAEQLRLGLPADAWPTPALLGQL